MKRMKDDKSVVEKISLKRVTVNSLGEVLLDRELVGSVSSVDTVELERRLKRKATQKDIDREFGRLLKEFARGARGDAGVVAYVRRVWRLQNLSDTRFHIRGVGGRIVVGTEFLHFAKDREFWRDVNRVARLLGAKVGVMWECRNKDVAYYHYGTPEQREVRGPHYGKVERQVELAVPLPVDATTRLTRATIRKMQRATQALWSRAGVAVL